MPDAAETPKDIFISYTGADRAWAEWIAWQLEAEGFGALLQAWDFGPGTNFVSQMKSAAQAEQTIAVYSPAYFRSRFSEDEWTAAFVKRSLIPVRVEECELPDFLKPLVYVDLVGLTPAAAREALLKGVRRGRRKPSSAPEFPCPHVAEKRFPGQLPRVFEVPFARNRNFTGRDQMLEDLQAKLKPGSATAIVQAISGMGGVGKTSLALEYCYRFRNDYDVIWWLRAEQASTLATDFANLAQPLDLPNKAAANQPEVIAAVRNWLANNSGWLLVFDNAVDAQAIEAYRPHSENGNILITSRNPVWGSIADRLPLQELARRESVRFLLSRTGRDEAKAADQLSELLGDLPLALTQAAAYVEAKDISIADYIARLGSHSRKLLEPVAATFAMAFEKLAAESPEGLKVLTLSAFLAPDNIPRSLLSAAVKDDLEFDDAVAALRRYGLIETTEQSISIHRLLQKIVRDRLDPETQREGGAEALRLVRYRFPPQPEDYREWPICAPLLPHALQAIEHATGLGVAMADVRTLLYSAGVFEFKRGQFERGRNLLTRAIETEEKLKGPINAAVAVYLTTLGDLLSSMDELDLAEKSLRRALEIDKALGSTEHPFSAIRLSNLARVLMRTGKFEQSLRYAKRALEIDEKALGPKHQRVAFDEDAVGMSLYYRNEKGDLAQAEQHLLRALSIDHEALGPEHYVTATHWSDLGSILAVEGKFVDAYDCFRRCLAIYRKTLPSEHPYIKIAEANASEFVRFMREGANRRKAALKPNDPEVGRWDAVIADFDSFLESMSISKAASQRLP